MKPRVVGFGYCQAQLQVNGVREYRKEHRIVAEAFIENPLGKPEIDHINGNRADNRAENLRWVTRAENLNTEDYKRKHSLISRRGGNPNAKRVSATIAGEEKKFACCADCAEYLGVSKQTICNALKGRTQLKGITIKYI